MARGKLQIRLVDRRSLLILFLVIVKEAVFLKATGRYRHDLLAVGFSSSFSS